MKTARKIRRSRHAVKRPAGVVLHRGESPFNGEPCVAIAILRSSNKKTGDMVQTYILLDDGRSPVDAVHAGADKAVCGDCPMRGLAGFVGRRCYVNIGQGPQIVHKSDRPRDDETEVVTLAWREGKYPNYTPADHDQFFRGRTIRWGTYGEPVLIPIDMVARLSAMARSWTGYTHQWTKPEFAAYRDFFMASVHTPAEGAEAGYRATCVSCTLCKGRGGALEGARLPRNIVISTHGGTAVMAASRLLAVAE